MGRFTQIKMIQIGVVIGGSTGCTLVESSILLCRQYCHQEMNEQRILRATAKKLAQEYLREITEQ